MSQPTEARVSATSVTYKGNLKKARVNSHETAFMLDKDLYVIAKDTSASEYLKIVEPHNRAVQMRKGYGGAAIGLGVLVGGLLFYQYAAGPATIRPVAELLPSLVGATAALTILRLTSGGKVRRTEKAVRESGVKSPLAILEDAHPQLLERITPEVREQINSKPAQKGLQLLGEMEASIGNGAGPAN